MATDLRRMEDFLLHLFAPLTDVNVIRFSHERIIISGIVSVQVVPSADGKFVLSSNNEEIQPITIDDEFNATTSTYDLYCVLLRELLTEEYLDNTETDPPEPTTEKKT